MKKKSTQQSSANQNLRKKLREDYARGIPDFATSLAASKCSEDMKRYLVFYIQQKTTDPVTQRQMIQKAFYHLEEMETEVKNVIEKHMMSFIYNL